MIIQRYDEYLLKVKLDFALASLLISEYTLPLQLMLRVLDIIPSLQLVPYNLIHYYEVCTLLKIWLEDRVLPYGRIGHLQKILPLGKCKDDVLIVDRAWGRPRL